MDSLCPLPFTDILFNHVDAFGNLLIDQVFHAHLPKPKISQVTKRESSLLLQRKTRPALNRCHDCGTKLCCEIQDLADRNGTIE